MMTKKPEHDLRKYYHILLEMGVILSMLIFIFAFKIRIPESRHEFKMVQKQEVIKMEQVIQTEQQNLPAAPPRPQVPVEVPNDEVFTEQEFNIDAELNLDEPLQLPAPPKQEPKDENKEQEESEDEIFVVVEQQPELIGGIDQLQSKIKYPELARKVGIEGRVYVQFIVDKDGSVQSPEIIRGIGGGCDEEALRVIQQAKFQPGLQRGRPVKVKMTIPIVFRLKK